MEDIYWRTLRRMNDVAAYVGDGRMSGNTPVRDLMAASSDLLDSLVGGLQPTATPHA